MASVSTISLRESGLNQAVAKEFRLDTVDVALRYCEEKPYGVLKTFYVFADFLGHLGYLPKDNEALNQACFGAKITKLSRSPWEFVSNVTKTSTTVSDWIEGKVVERKKGEEKRKVEATDIVRDANGIISPLREMWELMVKTLYLPNSALFQTFKGVSGASLILAMGWNSFDHLNTLADSKLPELKGKERSKESYKVVGTMIKLARDVSYVALGIIVILTTFFQFVFAPFTTCMLSTASVVFTILGYYHSNLGQLKKLN